MSMSPGPGKAFTELRIRSSRTSFRKGDVLKAADPDAVRQERYDGCNQRSDLIGTHFRYGQTIVRRTI